MNTTISSLDELDRMLKRCDDASNDDALRAVFSQFQMAPSADYIASLPPDPLSDDYRDMQMALYEKISGRAYGLECEHTPMDVDAAVISPFPYSTRSTATAGDHLVVIGEFLRLLRLPPGARILELGPGWGNLTLALSALGFQVTAVDVEAGFCDVIRRRAHNAGLAIRAINADFSWVETCQEQFDAVLFFECFHHAADHLRLLRSLHKVLQPGGRVYLGAEPILDDFPVPWGLRMDGQSLWSIRKFGWMELGFNTRYFQDALRATGWVGQRHPAPRPASWGLRRSSEPLVLAATDPRFGTQTGLRGEHGLSAQDAPAGHFLYGPYIALPPGRYTARLNFDAAKLAGSGNLDACYRSGTRIINARAFTLPAEAAHPATLMLDMTVPEDCEDLEIRLFNDAGFTAQLTGIEVVLNEM